MTSRSARSSSSASEAISRLYRDEWGRLIALLVARTRRIDLAEDAVSEAFTQAARAWPAGGVPTNPAGWLYTTAYRSIVDTLRAQAVAGRKAHLLAVRPGGEDVSARVDELADERLQLILLCCHPALPAESRSALALRLVMGTTTEEIARLFLVSTATMAARITRAKKKLVAAGIPLSSPVADELRMRLDEVCRTTYLAFTAGYTPGTGPELLRADVAGEAVRLAEILHQLVPRSAQVTALLALLTLQHSRRDARVCDGRLITLGNQDRSRWHEHEIAFGLTLASSLEPTTGYAQELRLQAHIAAEHAQAASTASTNWVAIVARYEELEACTQSAVVRLNRAVAVAEVAGPSAALEILDGLDDALDDHHRLFAVRAEMAGRVGDRELAARSYRAALALTTNDVERAFLADRLGALE